MLEAAGNCWKLTLASSFYSQLAALSRDSGGGEIRKREWRNKKNGGGEISKKGVEK